MLIIEKVNKREGERGWRKRERERDSKTDRHTRDEDRRLTKNAVNDCVKVCITLLS